MSLAKIIKDCFNVVANHDILLTIGITPSRPDTGYGYIQYTDQKLESQKK